MADRTAGARVARYRSVQAGTRGIARVEVQVPAWAADSIKREAEALRDRAKRFEAARPDIDAVLTTVNAPMRHHMAPETLLACICSPVPLPQWRMHMASLFDEPPVEALHRLVLTGVVSFEDLERAARTWGIRDGQHRAWVKEMADFRMARPAS